MEGSTLDMFRLRARAQASGPGSNRGQGSNSASGVVSTLIPVFLVAVIVFTAFLLLRKKFARVYRPRTDNAIVRKHQLTPDPKTGFFSMIRDFNLLPDNVVLQHNSVDGYLFLRFFKILIILSFVGCCITWPILFPVNATGGGVSTQLDVLSMSNVVNPNRYYAHTFVAWGFLGFVFLLIAYERIQFVALRQAYFLSSFQALRLSSRTVLFMSVPKEYMQESALKELLGSHAKKVWFAKDCDKLEDSVKDYGKAATKLEQAQVKLSQNANKLRLEVASGKSKRKDLDSTDHSNPVAWIDPKKRPTHKLKFLIGKKVDTINWCRSEIPNMVQNITRQQKDILGNTSKNQSAAFVEFDSQVAAQHAFQLVAKSPRKQMNPRYIGVAPSEVIWKNLKVTYSARKIKMLIATTLIWLLIIFWAIPVAFVGILSNINYITDKVPFLSFINDIPSVILGVVTGLLPSVLLAVLMALVPIICRLLAKLGGEPTLSAVELKTQSWYFGFQVVQVFLITTFASSATSVVTQIINQPLQAPTLLATNLPKASNFYISYFIVFGLGQATMQLLAIVPLLMVTILGKILDKTPRKQYNRWVSLIGLGWGSEYPKWTNLGVIAISYSCIAPLVLGFSTVGFTLLYLAFRYKWLFVLGNKVDMKGEAYNKALKQLLTGVYLATVCLIGLFAIGTAENSAGAGPLVLMILFLVTLIVANVGLNIALGPLERNLPLDMFDKELQSMSASHQVLPPKDVTSSEYDAESHGYAGTYDDSQAGTLEEGRKVSLDRLNQTDYDDDRNDKKPGENILTRKVRKLVSTQYSSHKKFINSWPAVHDLEPEYHGEDYEMAFYNPALRSRDNIIWLARDECGVSAMEREENEKAKIETSDQYAWFNYKNKVEWDVKNSDKVPIREPLLRY